jgi:uncharacterized damage-inducible protein DinB
MLPAVRALAAELDAEIPATRRVLERVPEDKFGWRPHAKSMSAGQLAHHVAAIPANVARIAQSEGLDVSTRPTEYPASVSRDGLLALFEESVASARQFLAGLDEAQAHATWRLSFGEREIFALPRLAAMRTIAFNHWYHHRGELVVYLRLLDISVPVVYGRSADENPFATAAVA